MASPNAQVALRLRGSSTYRVVSQSFRDAWVTACLKLPASSLECPQDGEVFEVAPGDSISSVAKERFRMYGLAVGMEFTIAKVRTGRSVEIHCKHFGVEKDNFHKIKDLVVRKDPVTGELKSDRKRNRDDQRTGCQVRYAINYSLKSGSEGERQWVSHWMHDPTKHKGHPFPNNPMLYLPLKRMLDDYRKMEFLGRGLVESRMPYSEARTYFLKNGINGKISSQEYYNLGKRLMKDIKKDDTAGALIAVFEDAGWRYCLRKQTSTDSEGRKVNKIVNIFFYNPESLEVIQRYTSNSLLIVDATFRTNDKGMPLIIGVGKSSTDRTFPVAFCWVPEEDAESYDFFFDRLREELYQGIPDPAVVLTDLSTGMTKAYDVLKCLPNSQLQYCNWHAVQAMRSHLQGTGHYTSDQMDKLEGLCWDYVQSNTELQLSDNRQALETALHSLDKNYLQGWQQRERRLIKCFTKYYTNLGQYATSRVEKYNSNIHKIATHQLSLHESAQRLMAFVNDFFRDFSDELDQSRTRNVIGIDKHYFSYLARTVTTWVIRQQIGPQWRRLIDGRLPPCTGAFRKQYLLPCAHDLQQAYNVGYPIAKLMVHPRWWIDGHVPTTREWLPQDAIADAQVLPLEDSVADSVSVDTQKLFYDVMAVHARLPADAARRYERQLQELLQKHLDHGCRTLEVEELPLNMPDDQPRVSRKKLATRAEKLKKEARRQERAAARAERDDDIRRIQQSETQAPFGSQITIRTRSPVDSLTSETSSSISLDDEPLGTVVSPEAVEVSFSRTELHSAVPPASTAPPAMTGRSMRKRRGTGFYATLLSGDSQEIKRAKQDNF